MHIFLRKFLSVYPKLGVQECSAGIPVCSTSCLSNKVTIIFKKLFLTNKIKNYNPSFRHQYKKYLVPPKYWPVPNLTAEQWCLKNGVTENPYEIFRYVTVANWVQIL